MDSNETNNSKLQQQLKDLTKCSICTEIFTDPRILPCIHTFCVKCLEDVASKSNKKSEQNMLCPLCKREFVIPLEGFNGIQKNFFMARLTEIGMSVGLSRSLSRHLCDACLEDYNDPTSATQVPSAEMFCTVCCLKLCRNCLKIHRKGKLTINHKLETVENQQMRDQNKSKLIPEFCKEHESERFKMYCSDCKKIVCSFCYIESHQGHKWSDVDKASDEFCQKIQNHIQSLALKNKGLREKREELIQAKTNILASMESLELEINQRKTLLKETIDNHANLLLMEVEALRQEKLRLVQLEEEDIDLQVANEECYSLYCQEITTKGSTGDICRDEAQLSQRAIELQEINDSICQRHLDSAHVVLQMSKLDEFVKENGQNFVGDIEGSKTWFLLSIGSTVSTEAPEFKPGYEVSVAPTDTSEDNVDRLAEKHLTSFRDSVTSCLQTAVEKIFKASILNPNYAHIGAHLCGILDKTFTYHFERTSLRNIFMERSEAEYDRLMKLSKDKHGPKELPGFTIFLVEVLLHLEVDNLVKEFAPQILQLLSQLLSVPNQENIECVKKVLQRSRWALQSSNPQETSDVLAKFRDMIAASEASKCRVVLTKTQRITGMGIIEDELFIATEMCPTVEVFNSLTFTYLRCWSLSGLTHPEDMVASLNPKCLYIFNAVVDGRIYQVNTNGSIISSWVSGSINVRLSITSESNVVVTYLGDKKIKEYRPTYQSRLAQQLVLQGSSTHAVKLKAGNFVVSRGKGTDNVFEIDAYGKDKNSFKGKSGSTFERLNCPEQLAVDQHGSVLVVDRGNRRVLLLNSNLEFQKELLSEKNGLQDPRAMILDYKTNRLFVFDHDSADNLWRILVINIA